VKCGIDHTGSPGMQAMLGGVDEAEFVAGINDAKEIT
jgi:hypothetical protein